MKTIKDIPIYDRPRERLKNFGVSSLSVIELLTIIIKTGTSKMSSKDIAENILKKIKSVSNLKYLSYEELINMEGIGDAKASFILATIELGKRINNNEITLNNKKFDNALSISEYFNNILKDKKQEYFYSVYLDTSKRIIGERLLFIGTINESIVHPREVFKEAYLLSASAIILIHNHPNDNLLPSNNDIDTTNRLIEVGLVLGVRVIDHIIIGNDKYFSFFENGLIK